MSILLDKIRTLYYTVKYQYILQRATFGPGTTIRCKLSIVGPGQISIGSNCIISSGSFDDDYVTIYTHQPKAKIVIGNNVILRATRFGSHLSIKIDDGAVIESVSLFDTDFHNIDATMRDKDVNKKDRPVVIGKNCYVGRQCLCSKGTTLNFGVTLLPGSVIGTKTIPEGKFVSGNPAMPLRQ